MAGESALTSLSQLMALAWRMAASSNREKRRNNRQCKNSNGGRIIWLKACVAIQQSEIS